MTGLWVDQQFELMDLCGEWGSGEVRLRRALNAKPGVQIPLLKKQGVTEGFHKYQPSPVLSYIFIALDPSFFPYITNF